MTIIRPLPHLINNRNRRLPINMNVIRRMKRRIMTSTMIIRLPLSTRIIRTLSPLRPRLLRTLAIERHRIIMSTSSTLTLLTCRRQRRLHHRRHLTAAQITRRSRPAPTIIARVHHRFIRHQVPHRLYRLVPRRHLGRHYDEQR